MQIESIEVFPVRLPMKAVLTLPRGPSRTLDEGKRVALVKITDRDGHVGWGEAGPSRRWSAETLESCVSSIRSYLAPALLGHDLFDIAGLHEKMNRELASGLDPGQPIAKCALDVAGHDLIDKRIGNSVQSWLDAKLDRTVFTDNCPGWYTNDEGKVTAMWPASHLAYAKATSRFKPDEYISWPEPTAPPVTNARPARKRAGGVHR